ncbi:hypothetical protein AB0Q95_06915 [Streptomyces sp. NPDC059900]|uniref:hypothetical protein n=1 Tax=Streptomyces sp. NPDC059900 TaxID=3155816 RepID=UPI003430F928
MTEREVSSEAAALQRWRCSGGRPAPRGSYWGTLRGTTAADAYAQFAEAAVRLYAVDVARQLGIAHQVSLGAELGWALTCRLQGRGDLLKLTAPQPESALTRVPAPEPEPDPAPTPAPGPAPSPAPRDAAR